MIKEIDIQKLVEEKIRDTEIFLVNVKVGKANDISVLLDTLDGISIESCRQISLYLNQALEHQTEDFSLEVSSPGIGRPLKVPQQYQQNIGRKVEVIAKDGSKTTGRLTSAAQNQISVEVEKKEKPQGAKRKKLVKRTFDFDTKNIKATKVIPEL